MNDREKNKEKPTDSLTIIREFFTMELVIKTENYGLYKVDRTIFKIQLNSPNYSLVNSLVRSRLIMGSSTDEMYRTITFKAETVKTLKQYIGKTRLSIPEVAKIMRSLIQQLSYLINKESSTIIGYNLEDILVINDETTVFLGSEFVANIDTDTNMVMISCPYSSKDFFFSPEMLHIKEIPAFIHYKTSYFSLACVIIFLLLGGDNEFYQEYVRHKKLKTIIEHLDVHPIKETKLYWLLLRCLVEEPNNRSVLLL